jgi:histidinol-phosphatase (PHP family)
MAQIVPANLLDYYILSIHSLGTGKDMRAIDYTDKEFAYLVKLAGGDIKNIIKRYYTLLANETLKNKPDIIGHIDLIKKNNVNSKYFNEKENWYLDIVDNCLKEIKKTGSIMEINTGGVARYGPHCLYPCDEILVMARDYNIPLMLNSDAHNKDNLDFYYEETIRKAKKLGIDKLSYITCDGRDEYKI